MVENITPTPAEVSGDKLDSSDPPKKSELKEKPPDDQVKAADETTQGITQEEIEVSRQADEAKIAELREQIGAVGGGEVSTIEQPSSDSNIGFNSKEKADVSKNPTETVIIDSKEYTVRYVPKEEIYPAFGYSGGDTALVRQDLAPRVQKFVRAHELYHCQDEANWGGWLGKEIRANIMPGLRDPIGLFATGWDTVSDFNRIKFYLNRLKVGR